MKFKVGDKVKLNKNIRVFKYKRAGVSYNEIGEIISVDGRILYVQFPSRLCAWMGLEKDLELVNKGMFFKKLPNNYTGTIEVENGYIAEKEILDEEEKEYLSAVIKPFRNKIVHISKYSFGSYREYIFIHFKEAIDSFRLPKFEKSTMYKGMVVDKEYTLKELGLDV